MRRASTVCRAERGGIVMSLLVLLVVTGLALGVGYHWLKNNYESRALARRFSALRSPRGRACAASSRIFSRPA